MKYKFIKTGSQLIMLLAVIVLAAGATFAAPTKYYLKAERFDKLMPDGITTIPMWGYNDCPDGNFDDIDPNACDNYNGPVESPGPVLEVPKTSKLLQIRLKNGLEEVTSLVIPGQIASMSPKTFVDGTGRSRVKSFDIEVPASGGKRWYEWELRPGTYLYHSGSHPQVQVQMGLYGAVKKDAAKVDVYDPLKPNRNLRTAYTDKDNKRIRYNNEALLLFSEIDPALHLKVDTGDKDTIAGGWFAGPKSTLDYNPTYYLVNGQPFSSLGNSISAGVQGQKTLLRMLNAGLKTHVPTINGSYMDIIAEDGFPYPYSKDQYSLRMPALKTRDAIISPSGIIEIKKAEFKPNNNFVIVAVSDAGGAADLKITKINGNFVTPIDMTYIDIDDKWKGVIPGGAIMEPAIGSVTVSGLAQRYPVYDRRLDLTSAGQSGGGMLIYLDLTGEVQTTSVPFP